jgi:hypothetical protein
MFTSAHSARRQTATAAGPKHTWRRGLTAVAVTLAGSVAALTLTAGAAQADTYDVRITNLRSGLHADVMWASTAAYQGVFLWPTNGSLSQKFDLLDSGGGYFRIRARHSSQCLMIDWRQGNYNGTKIIQYPYCSAGYAPGEWRRGWVSYPPQCSGNVCSSNGTQSPVLINRYSGRCLDANNGSSAPPPAQAVLQQWDCIRWASDWNAGNQLWKIGNEGYL